MKQSHINSRRMCPAMDGHSSSRDASSDVLALVSHSSPRSNSHRISRSSHYPSQYDVPNSPTGHLPNPFTHPRHPSLHRSMISDNLSPKGSVRYSTPSPHLTYGCEDPSVLDEEEDPVELPPEYTDRRNRPSEQPLDVKQTLPSE